MNDPLAVGVVAALIGVLGVGLGTVLGWRLNLSTIREQEHKHQAEEQKREAEKQKREAETRRRVRLLLRLECRQNLTALSEFWGIVSRGGVYLPEKGWLTSVGTSMSEGEYDKLRRLAVTPLPVWGRDMWESQASLVADALDKPGEIDRVYKLYSDLETFAEWREELQAEFATPEGQRLSERYSVWMLGKEARTFVGEDEVHIDSALRDFINRTGALWNECQAIYNRALPYKDNDIIAP
jgi:hypothetical protein